MKKDNVCAAVVTAALLALSTPAEAHHSFAMFDQTKLSELRHVVVKDYKWANPHVFVVVESGDTTYTLECGSPSNMQESGWKFHTLKSGDRIDVVFFPLRNGKPGGALKVATLADGKKLEAW